MGDRSAEQDRRREATTVYYAAQKLKHHAEVATIMAQGMRESLEQGSLSSDPFWRRKAVALEAVEALDKAGYFIGSLMPGGDGGEPQ